MIRKARRKVHEMPVKVKEGDGGRRSMSRRGGGRTRQGVLVPSQQPDSNLDTGCRVIPA